MIAADGPLALEVAALRHRHEGAERDTPGETSFSLAAGERALLVGPNGGGKTTLLRRVVGLERGPGTIRVGGVVVERRSLRALRRRVGLLWQPAEDGLLLPTVVEDVAFGPANDGLPGAEARALAMGQLAALGLSSLASRPIARLSAGERQMVAVAGLLARRPGLLLLDEPTASLDDGARGRLLAALDALPATVLLVSHAPADRRDGWRVIELRAG